MKAGRRNIWIWFAGVGVAAGLAPRTVVAQLLDPAAQKAASQGDPRQALAAPDETSRGAGEPEAPQPLPWQLSQKWPLNEDDPESSIPNARERDRNPLEFGYLLQDLIEGAEQARKAGDDDGVVRYYRAIVKAAPERAKGWSKLCEAYATVNDHKRAVATCGAALGRPGVELQDFTRYVHEMLLVPGKLTPASVKALKDVLAHLDKQPNIEAITAGLRCDVGVALGDPKILEAGTAALTRLQPDNPKTIVYQWTLAMQRGQTEAAGRLLKRAKALNLPAENVERMQALTDSGGHHRYVWMGLGAATFLLLAAGALALARRRRTAGLAPAVR